MKGQSSGGRKAPSFRALVDERSVSASVDVGPVDQESKEEVSGDEPVIVLGNLDRVIAALPIDS